MFNIQNLMQMFSQAMVQKLVGSDALFTQWQNFTKKMGLPSTSRAEFDSLINQFNNTDANTKMNTLQNVDKAKIQNIISNMMK